MMSYSLQLCTNSGKVLSNQSVEAHSIYGALAEANRRAAGLVASLATAPARIDIADAHGRTVGRLLWSEVVAATG